MDITLTPTLLAAIPVVVGVVEVLKATGIPSKWAPLMSLALGLGASLLLGGTPFVIVLGGLVVGLSASGLYSSSKTTFSAS